MFYSLHKTFRNQSTIVARFPKASLVHFSPFPSFPSLSLSLSLPLFFFVSISETYNPISSIFSLQIWRTMLFYFIFWRVGLEWRFKRWFPIFKALNFSFVFRVSWNISANDHYWVFRGSSFLFYFLIPFFCWKTKTISTGDSSWNSPSFFLVFSYFHCPPLHFKEIRPF